jgi:hypothetical protein
MLNKTFVSNYSFSVDEMIVLHNSKDEYSLTFFKEDVVYDCQYRNRKRPEKFW